MSTFEGRVVFRNRMGSTILIRIETSVGQAQTLAFSKAALGEERFGEVRQLDLGDRIRGTAEPTTRRWSTPDVLDVSTFEHVL